MAKVMCPNQDCKTVSPIPDAALGRKVRCKVCNTIFVAAALPGAAPAAPAAPRSGDSGIITVVARRVGGQGRSGIFDKSTVIAAGGPPPAPRTAGRAVWLVVAAAALVLPALAAGGFVAFQRLGGGAGPAASPGLTTEPDGDEQARVYGGIEIASSGVKATVIEYFQDKNFDYNYRILTKKSADPKLVTGIEKTGQFNQGALDDAVADVQQFFNEITREHHLPPEKIFIIGSSGLFNKLREAKDLPGDPDALIRKDQTTLDGLVEAATGKKIEFINVSQEVALLFGGLVPEKHKAQAVMIDVGTGGTRGGYHESGGVFASFEAPGVGAFETKIKARAGKSGSLPDAAGLLAEQELSAPLQKALERGTGFYTCQRVYLNGGIVWAMATFQHPEDRGVNVKLTADDFRAFHDLVCRNPEQEFPTISPPADLDPAVRQAVEADLNDIRPKFKTSKLIAGAQVLEALSAELKFKDKELYFTRYGDIGVLLSYIGESYKREKGAAK